MIFANGLQKSGTHLLMSHLVKFGFVPSLHPTVKGYPKGWIQPPPEYDLGNDVVHSHVTANHELPGAVITIFRNPRDCLVSCARYKGESIPDLICQYYGNKSFVDMYFGFLPWMKKAPYVRFESLPTIEVGLSETYTGNHSNWRVHWNVEIDEIYSAAGGHALDVKSGYSENLNWSDT